MGLFYFQREILLQTPSHFVAHRQHHRENGNENTKEKWEIPHPRVHWVGSRAVCLWRIEICVTRVINHFFGITQLVCDEKCKRNHRERRRHENGSGEDEHTTEDIEREVKHISDLWFIFKMPNKEIHKKFTIRTSCSSMDPLTHLLNTEILRNVPTEKRKGKQKKTRTQDHSHN